MNDEIAEYQRAVAAAEKAVRDAERLEGAKEQLASQLREEYGTDDPDEIQAELDKMIKQQVKDKARIDQLCAKFDEKYSERLSDD